LTSFRLLPNLLKLDLPIYIEAGAILVSRAILCRPLGMDLREFLPAKSHPRKRAAAVDVPVKMTTWPSLRLLLSLVL
jgi:hypothetical protein